MRYTVRRIPETTVQRVEFALAEEGRVCHVRSESSSHRPETTFRVLCDGGSLYVRFEWGPVCGSVLTDYQAPVCTTAASNFLCSPKRGRLFQFVVNAGALCCYYVEDPTRSGGADVITPVPRTRGTPHRGRSSLPRVVDPVIEDAGAWHVGYGCLGLLLDYVENGRNGEGCGARTLQMRDLTSLSHGVKWSPFRTQIPFVPLVSGNGVSVRVRTRVRGCR
jgi:hypothetical protein